MAQTTISVGDQTLERFKKLKSNLDEAQSDVPDHTNESFLMALMDTWERDDAPTDARALSDADVQDIINEIAATADDTGRVDDDALAREVVSQIDYAHLADRVADEVERRMR